MASICLAAALTTLASSVEGAHRVPPEPLEEGWNGTVELGGQHLGGNSRSRSLSLAAQLSRVSGRLETELAAETLSSTVTLATERRDAAGEVVTDASDRTVLVLTRGRSHERFVLGGIARWFWTPRAYQFALFEHERDRPSGTASRRRLGTGAGYKLWRHREDFIAAELGVGDKRLDYTDGERLRGAIGYAALRAARRIGERLRLEAACDADFAGDDPFAALELGAGLRVSERVLLKLRHVERFNTRRPDPRNPLDSRRDTLTTLTLEVALF